MVGIARKFGAGAVLRDHRNGVGRDGAKTVRPPDERPEERKPNGPRTGLAPC